MAKNSTDYNQLFIGGDLSGIQKFLYNITSKNAMVSLIGRSHYLSKYMSDVCSGITNLPSVKAGNPHTIYCSGGKFYVIADNSDNARDELSDFIQVTKKELWAQHKGELSINIGAVPFSENSDGTVNASGQDNRKCGLLWELVTAQFARQKNQKFKNEIVENFNQFFEPLKIASKPKVCAVTGIESDDCEKFEDTYLLPSVKEQIIKGRELSHTRNFKTFHDYAGNTYLGILRMDVDGLGTRFIRGFDSITDYQKFSNYLTKFFEDGELQKIQRKAEYAEYLNIVYAGGDDIFAVGRWDKIIEFAHEVSTEFASYVNDKTLTISGGVAIVHEKFPIAKAAEMAGEAEDLAKSHNNNAKNAFCMFGETISWKNDFDYVKQYKEKFVDLIKNHDMSRGILHQIMSYYLVIRHNKYNRARGKRCNYSYMWHLPYYLTRYIGRYKNNEEIKTFCENLKNHELTGNEEKFRLIAVAARWAELTIRNNNNNNKNK